MQMTGEPQVRRLDATDDGVCLQVTVWGAMHAARVPLLVIHGFTANARAFEGIAAALVQAHERAVVGFDLRGRGGSDAPEGSANYGVERHARDAVHVLDALGVAQADVLGWSLGASIGLCLAARAPERVRSLTLLDPSLGEASEIARASLATVQGRLRRDYANLDEAMAQLRKGPAFAGTNDTVTEPFLRGDLQAKADADGRYRHVMMVATLAAEQGASRPPLTALVPGVVCPVLILRATDALITEGDQLLSADVAQRAVRLFRDARVVDVPGSNHYSIALAAPDVAVDALRGFLAEQDAAGSAE